MIQLIFTVLAKFCISASFAMIYVFSAEVFPTVVRNVGVGYGALASQIGGIIVPFLIILVSRLIYHPQLCLCI